MKNSKKMTKTIADARSNLEKFITPNPTFNNVPIIHKLDWLDPAIILLVFLGGASFGIAFILSVKTI